ncbi:unnamed protein product [Ceratitis capitata]|uniref:(Mediterranean fruit fly) hypothetical protein n=1 Tax=Ceratitis capitata TaxID=7213 RepID=A0A811VJZ1_CERCA|nr:unnamed protein product [Ceratitis capitata]
MAFAIEYEEERRTEVECRCSSSNNRIRYQQQSSQGTRCKKSYKRKPTTNEHKQSQHTYNGTTHFNLCNCTGMVGLTRAVATFGPTNGKVQRKAQHISHLADSLSKKKDVLIFLAPTQAEPMSWMWTHDVAMKRLKCSLPQNMNGPGT